MSNCICTNKRAEAAFVAKEIQQLVKTKNLRYRDIAVIASDIEQLSALY